MRGGFHLAGALTGALPTALAPRSCNAGIQERPLEESWQEKHRVASGLWAVLWHRKTRVGVRLATCSFGAIDNGRPFAPHYGLAAFCSPASTCSSDSIGRVLWHSGSGDILYVGPGLCAAAYTMRGEQCLVRIVLPTLHHHHLCVGLCERVALVGIVCACNHVSRACRCGQRSARPSDSEKTMNPNAGMLHFTGLRCR